MTLRNLLYVLLFFTFTFTACDNNSSSSAEKPLSVDSLLSGFEEEEDPVPVVDSTAVGNGEEDVPPPIEMTAKEKEDAKKIKEKRKEIIKEQLSSSPFKNCEDVLAKYKELTDAYITGNDRWKEWDANDVIYNSCKKKTDYESQFSALMDKMDDYDDAND